MADLSQIVVEEVIKNNFNIVTLAWSSGMVWWLSASAFCLTLITKLYPNKEELKEQGYHVPIGIFVSLFLVSMILFGVATLYELSLIEQDINVSFIASCSSIEIPGMEHIFTIVRKLYLISTSTMVVFLLSWIYLWFSEKPFNIINKP